MRKFTRLQLWKPHKVGFPEARILIANVVVDLALSPKSNSAYMAMDAPWQTLENQEIYRFLVI